MAIRVLLPQPILPAGYEYLREHGYEVVDGRGFTEDDIVADIADCDAIIVRTAKITKRIFDAAPPPAGLRCYRNSIRSSPLPAASP